MDFNFYEEFLSSGGGKRTAMTVNEIKQALKSEGVTKYSKLNRMELLHMAAKQLSDPMWKELLKEEKAKMRKKAKEAEKVSNAKMSNENVVKPKPKKEVKENVVKNVVKQKPKKGIKENVNSGGGSVINYRVDENTKNKLKKLWRGRGGNSNTNPNNSATIMDSPYM